MSVSSGSMSIGVLAILTGLVGSYAFRQLLVSEPPVAEVKAKMVMQPLATMELGAGREITLGDVGLAYLTEDQLVDRKLNDSFVMKSPEQIIGRTTRKKIAQGQPFRTTDLYPEGEGPNPAEELKHDERAYTLEVSPREASTISKNSYVDVNFKTFPRAGSKDGSTLPIPERTWTLMQAVRVIDVFRPKPAKKDNSTLDLRYIDGAVKLPNPTITLALSLNDSKVMQAVAGHGMLSFAVRSPTDTIVRATAAQTQVSIEDILGIEKPAPPAPPQQPVPPLVTEIYRRGSMQAKAFDPYEAFRRLQYDTQRDATGSGQPLPPVGGAATPGAGMPAGGLLPTQPSQVPGVFPGGGFAPGGSTIVPQLPATPATGGGPNPVSPIGNKDPFGEHAPHP